MPHKLLRETALSQLRKAGFTAALRDADWAIVASRTTEIHILSPRCGAEGVYYLATELNAITHISI